MKSQSSIVNKQHWCFGFFLGVLMLLSACSRVLENTTDDADSASGEESLPAADSTTNSEDTGEKDTASDTSSDTVDEASTDTKDTSDPIIVDTDSDEFSGIEWWIIPTDRACLPCDGIGLTCNECWDCAQENIAKRKADACFADGTEDGNGCSALFHCRMNNCCDGADTCLKGLAMRSCMTACIDSVGPSEASLSLYNTLMEKLLCRSCDRACEMDWADSYEITDDNIFVTEIICYDNYIVDECSHPCLASDAGENETACYSWASWGGPCTMKQQACLDESAECAAVHDCVNSAFSQEGGITTEAVDQCLDDVTNEVRTLYIDWNECVFCDACDNSCGNTFNYGYFCQDV